MIYMLKIDDANKEYYDLFDDLSIDDKIYVLKLDDVEIGFGLVGIGTNNKLYINIFEKYRGNGYGSYLYLEMLKKINTDFKIRVDKNNFNIINIIVKYGGCEIGRDGKFITFFVTKYRV